MSTENPSSSSSDPNLPLALIAVTVAVLLLSQVGASRQATTMMKWQSENFEKQVTQMQAVDKQAAEAIEKRKEVVKQAGEIQNQLQTILNEVLDLAEKDKDKDAIELIKKWNVQRTAPNAAAPAVGTPAAAAPAAEVKPAADAKK